LKTKLKELLFADVAEIQEAVTDELKKVQKEEFSAASQKLYDRAKACIYMPLGLILNLRKRYVSSIFKKISPKIFGPHCVSQDIVHNVG
jgi:RNA polymerase-interacting CarD/CdnL/TRCF family regulator